MSRDPKTDGWVGMSLSSMGQREGSQKQKDRPAERLASARPSKRLTAQADYRVVCRKQRHGENPSPAMKRRETPNTGRIVI